MVNWSTPDNSRRSITRLTPTNDMIDLKVLFSLKITANISWTKLKSRIQANITGMKINIKDLPSGWTNKKNEVNAAKLTSKIASRFLI